jgi:5-methylcytosine-specific restriction endonuclease McrA
MGTKRTPPFPEYPTWSTAKFWGFIRSALRNRVSRWPPKIEAKREARRNYKGANKRQKFEYQCAICKGWFPDKEVEMDHIVPAGRLSCKEDLPGFVERLFVGKSGFRCLCKECHREVTNEER